jgi:hypothetical protein
VSTKSCLVLGKGAQGERNREKERGGGEGVWLGSERNIY